MKSSAKSPTKPTPGGADRRIMRDWEEVKGEADPCLAETDSVKDVRNKILNQQLIDSHTKEPSPLDSGASVLLKPKNLKALWGYVEVEPDNQPVQRRAERAASSTGNGIQQS